MATISKAELAWPNSRKLCHRERCWNWTCLVWASLCAYLAHRRCSASVEQTRAHTALPQKGLRLFPASPLALPQPSPPTEAARREALSSFLVCFFPNHLLFSLSFQSTRRQPALRVFIFWVLLNGDFSLSRFTILCWSLSHTGSLVGLHFMWLE